MEYSETYVKFFLHRNKVTEIENSQDIELSVLTDRRVSRIIDELQDWPCYEITNHKNVDHPLHKLSFIAELGFNKWDEGINNIIDRILENQSDEGPFQMLIDIPVRFGGVGKPIKSWVLSDAPVILYSLILLNGREITSDIRKGVDYVAGLVSENGWRCVAADELGSFRGPGRKNDPCPYATMFSLKMLSLTEEDQYLNEKTIGINTIFELWEKRKQMRPYLFAMGTGFKKLKLPFVWYDILNVVDTLSRYKNVHDDPRFREMLDIIQNKKTKKGYVPESVYLKSKSWDYGQKKAPSEYMTAVVQRIEQRVFD